MYERNTKQIAFLSCLIGIGQCLISYQSTAAELILPFDPESGEIPESITQDDDGTLYWSMSNSVWKRTPEGEVSQMGTLPIAAYALGVKIGPDHCVYTVSTSLSDIEGAFVWRICDPDEITQIAELDHSGGPNDLVIDSTGTIYVTDPFLGRIWKISPFGEVRIWLSHPLLDGNPENPILVFHSLGVDGIALGKNENALFVSNFDFGQILRIGIRKNGAPGLVSIWAADPLLIGADGIAFDRQGRLLVAVNTQDSIVMVQKNGEVNPIETGGLLDGPSSLVIENDCGTSTLWIANSAFGRAFGFIPGDPFPALLASRIEHSPPPWKHYWNWFRRLQQLRR